MCEPTLPDLTRLLPVSVKKFVVLTMISHYKNTLVSKTQQSQRCVALVSESCQESDDGNGTPTMKVALMPRYLSRRVLANQSSIVFSMLQLGRAA